MNPKKFAIRCAIEDPRYGVFASRRKAAAAYSVIESTLRGRLKGRQPHAIVQQNQQRLTLEQEIFMEDWILDEDRRAKPPSHKRVREMAT